jgi:glucokinase
MDSKTTAYLAIDAGGTFLKSAVLNAQWEVLPGSEFSVASNSDASREKILEAFETVILKGIRFVHQAGLKSGGIGLAFPGPFDMASATPLMKHKFQSIYGVDLRECFRSISEVPPSLPIYFMHDANAVLVGELWKGHAQGFENAAVVTLGTGLGFAVSEHKTVLCNEIGGPYLSIYNRPYQSGILEDYTAKRGLIDLYGQLKGIRPAEHLTVKDIGRMADEGDEVCRQVFSRVGEILADSLQEILIDRKISCLLFSGQISHSFRHMKPALVSGFSKAEHLERISLVSSIERAALSGAIIGMIYPEETLRFGG